MRPLPSSVQIVSLALHVIPALAVVAVVLSSALSRTGEIVAARVFGGPPDPHGTLAWRVVVQRKDRGWFSPVPALPVELQVHTTSDVASVQGITDQEGAWEARLPLPEGASPQVRAAVRSPSFAQPLASDLVAIHPDGWRASFSRIDPGVPGRSTGPLVVQVALLRGTIAASFPESILIHVTRDIAGTDDVGHAEILLDGEGVSFPTGASATTDAQGRAIVRVLMQHHAPRLGVRATLAPDLTTAWEGVLSGPPGAMWLDPSALAKNTIRVVSPVRHPVAYLTVFSENARLFGARLVLQPDQHGSASGSMPLPPLPREDCWLLVSPDPQGQGQETSLVAWPIRRVDDPPYRPKPAAQQGTPLLFDGMPAMTSAARTQALAARTRALILLAAAAVLEALLLAWRSRHARRELEAVLSSDSELDEAVRRTLVGGARFWWKLVVAAMLVAIGFGAIALVTWLDPR